ncbi:hypothetical protein LuPra_01686 [Luteitalea pratensis]|uniref:DUF3365 domain-containing protein n=1 Tax=Luteitalea pratensis TaxID=1855912 RepID=A0A143PJA1_LUTPR|nr:hypothetical protein [Luteitalea pratensis]AMY08486.1 hypothetical protein LuPra_01686 [Luteitalea pratensis]
MTRPAARRRRTRGTHVVRALVAVVLGYCLTFAWSMTIVDADAVPTDAEVQFARRSADLMQSTIFAALLQEFAETTPGNVEEGKHSISLIFDDRNESMRLVGEQEPLRANDMPRDPFEVTALEAAMQGQGYTAVEKVQGRWAYRRSVPLSNFHPACSMCHANFGPVNASQLVGALMLRVPVGN